jgi:hypothetical protein
MPPDERSRSTLNRISVDCPLSTEDNDATPRTKAKIRRRFLAQRSIGGKDPCGRFLFPKEGIFMRSRFWLSILSATALMPLTWSAAQAGSFFGPSCYGADYTYQNPNRSHNVFGCGPGTHCTARHPLFKHRLFHRNQNATANGMPMEGVPMNGMPMEGVPMNGMPSAYAPAPMVSASMSPIPIQTTAGVPGAVTATPAVSSRIVPIPAPLQAGPASPEPPMFDASGKPPF